MLFNEIDPHEDGGAHGEPNFQPVRLVMDGLPNIELWPRWSPSQAEWTLWSTPFASHFGPCAGDRRLPPPVTTRRRPWFRTRPRSPSFQTAGFYPRGAKGGEARPWAGKRASRAGARGSAGVGTLPAGRGGTLGRNRWCGCGTAHSLPKRGFPSIAGPSLFLSSRDSPVPARPGVTEWPERREGRTEFGRGKAALLTTTSL